MGEAFKDAIVTLEISRTKAGLWWSYVHNHAEKHFGIDEKDMELIGEISTQLNQLGTQICLHLIDQHNNKSLCKSCDEWQASQSKVYDKATGKSVTYNKDGQVVAGTLSDEELKKRLTPEAWDVFKRGRDDELKRTS